MAEGENKRKDHNLSRVPIAHLLVTVFFMMVLFALCTAAVFADNVDGDYTYTTTSAVNCTVTGYTNTTATHVTIPSTLGGYHVTAIGAVSAGSTLFANRLVLQSVTIPYGVTSINGYAFYYCNALKSVSIPDGVTSIGINSFYGCVSLSAVTFPDGLTMIGGHAFQDCDSLISVDIPDSVTSIGAAAFINCDKLQAVHFPKYLSVAREFVGGTEITTGYPFDLLRRDPALARVVIPEGVEFLAASYLAEDPALQRVALPSTLTYISGNSFANSVSLAAICFKGSLPSLAGSGICYNINPASQTWYFYQGAAGFHTGSHTYITDDSLDTDYTATGAYMYHITVNSSSADGSSSSLDGSTSDSAVTFEPDFVGLPGEKIYLNVTKDGYAPTSITVTSGASIIANSGLLNAPSFTMPPGDVVITATFAAITAPGVTVTSSTGDPTPTWVFTSANAGTFRWRIDNYPAWTTTAALSYTPTAALSDGTHTLYVEEQDSNGYWSLPASASITIDTTAPTVTLSSPTGAAVPTSTNDIVLAFNRTVTDVSGKTVTISNGTSDYVYTVSPSGIYVSGTGTSCKATIPVSSFKNAGTALSLSYGTTYTVKIEGGTYNNEASVGNAANTNLGAFTTVGKHKTNTTDSAIVVVNPDYAAGKVQVTIPYAHNDNEDPNKVVAYYTTTAGTVKEIEPYCVYDPTTGIMTIRANPMDTYTVGYNDVSFNDVTDSGWYRHYVDFIAAREVVQGFGDGTFGPNDSITRAQFVMILKNLAGDNAEYTKTSFSDVSATSWYAGAVEWAYENGVVYGANGKFNPDDRITRQDISAMIARYAEKYEGYTFEKTTNAVTFTDNGDIAAYASGAVSTMQQAGILAGPGDGTFRPLNNATRAEAAKMIDVLIRDMVK